MTRHSSCPSGGTGIDFDRIQDECRWLAELVNGLADGSWVGISDGRPGSLKPHFAALAMPLVRPLGIPVRSLADSWAKGRLVTACPKCGGASYVMGAAARSFPVKNRWFGICPACRAAVAGKKPGLGLLWRLGLAWAGSAAGKRRVKSG